MAGSALSVTGLALSVAKRALSVAGSSLSVVRSILSVSGTSLSVAELRLTAAGTALTLDNQPLAAPKFLSLRTAGRIAPRQSRAAIEKILQIFLKLRLPVSVEAL